MNDKRKLLGILVIGLFFLTFAYKLGFIWAHDHDLYAWIAKDIIVNHHWRLVGQVTSVDGVFIGGFYYYLMALMFWFSKMNPMSAIFATTTIGLVSIWSIYFLIKEFWGKKAALIGAFLWATTSGIALYQRWSVPTEPAILWSIWFLYVMFKAIKGDKSIIVLYGFLLGMVYHVHIALLPILPLPAIAYLLSNGTLVEKFKRIKFKEYFLCILMFFVFSSPFWLFEIKHNWSQIRSTLAAMKIDKGGPTGKMKLFKIENAVGREMQSKLVVGWETYKVEYVWLFFILAIIYLLKIKKLSTKQVMFMMAWIALICLAQFTSKRTVSEYYFTNMVPMFFLVFVLSLEELIKNKWLMGTVLVGYLLINGIWLKKYTNLRDGYKQKEQAVDYIIADAKAKNYPCISINYIAKYGDGVGFRYLFWYKGMKVVKTNPGIPQYDLVIPFAQSDSLLTAKYGLIGVIKDKKNMNVDPKLCDDSNLVLDPLLGYTE